MHRISYIFFAPGTIQSSYETNNSFHLGKDGMPTGHGVTNSGVYNVKC